MLVDLVIAVARPSRIVLFKIIRPMAAILPVVASLIMRGLAAPATQLTSTVVLSIIQLSFSGEELCTMKPYRAVAVQASPTAPFTAIRRLMVAELYTVMAMVAAAVGPGSFGCNGIEFKRFIDIFEYFSKIDMAAVEVPSWVVVDVVAVAAVVVAVPLSLVVIMILCERIQRGCLFRLFFGLGFCTRGM